jgi:hypothetical protein
VVQHPAREDAVEVVRGKWKLLRVGDLRVEAPRPGQLDHALGGVDRADARAELVGEPLREVARAAADVEQPLRPRLRHGVERDVLGIRAVDERAKDRVALGEACLARVLPAHEERVVELHGCRIGCPGMPRDGALPFSHTFTVEPTSANSPSWIWPAALCPAT